MSRRNLHFELDSTNVDRADVYVDDRPRASVDVTADHTVVSIPAAAGPERVRVEAFAGGDLVAADSADL